MVSALVDVYPLLGITMLPVLLYQLQKTVARQDAGAPHQHSFCALSEVIYPYGDCSSSNFPNIP